ncbi:MAG: response regulator transcription factor [Candidatus Gracilibacteria bacterium]
MHNILIVEDERVIAQSLQKYLQKSSYNVSVAYTYDDGLSQALSLVPDILCVDISLGCSKTGMDLCDEVRKVRPNIPLLIVTANSLEDYMEETLSLGLTDYISKPYHPEEIRIRIDHLMRMQKKYPLLEPISAEIETIADDFVVMHNNSKVVINGEEKHVPKTLKHLLDLLLEHRNTIVSHQYLHEKIWGDYFDVEKKREIRAHTKRLRHILGPKYGPKLQNVKSQGYIFTF